MTATVLPTFFVGSDTQEGADDKRIFASV